MFFSSFRYEGLFELDKKKIYRAIRLAERGQIVAIWGDFIASIRPVITAKLREIEEEESQYQVSVCLSEREEERERERARAIYI